MYQKIAPEPELAALRSGEQISDTTFDSGSRAPCGRPAIQASVRRPGRPGRGRMVRMVVGTIGWPGHGWVRPTADALGAVGNLRRDAFTAPLPAPGRRNGHFRIVDDQASVPHVPSYTSPTGTPPPRHARSMAASLLKEEGCCQAGAPRPSTIKRSAWSGLITRPANAVHATPSCGRAFPGPARVEVRHRDALGSPSDADTTRPQRCPLSLSALLSRIPSEPRRHVA